MANVHLRETSAVGVTREPPQAPSCPSREPLAATGPLGSDFCDPRLGLPAEHHVRGTERCILLGLGSFNTNFLFNNVLFLRLTYVIVRINNLFLLFF